MSLKFAMFAFLVFLNQSVYIVVCEFYKSISTLDISISKRIVVGNWFYQYFSIELKNMTYIQREHIPL